MIRAPRLVISRPMYAFNPATFGGEDWPFGGYRELGAAWFRRKNGRLNAVMGTYRLGASWGRPYDPPPPADTFDAWVGQHTDNRYGGTHLASWDGRALLCTKPAAVTPRVVAQRVAFLDAMLGGYPSVPAGYDGWFTFPKETSR